MTMHKLFIGFLALCCVQAHANLAEQDCREVGNFIHDQSGNVLYKLYNGVGARKAKTYNDNFAYAMRSLSWLPAYQDSNLSGWNLQTRIESYNATDEDSIKVLKGNQKNLEEVLHNNLKEVTVTKLTKEKLALKLLYAPKFCKLASHPLICQASVIRILSMGDMIQIKHPEGRYGTMTMSLPKQVKDLFLNPDYVKGMTLATDNIRQMIADQSANRTLKYKTILPLLIDSFRESLHKNPTDAAWDLIAVYATRGASLEGMSYFLEGTTIRGLMKLMDVVNGMHYLDHKATLGSAMFSLPPMKNHSCVFGKSYHFWMAAYFSRYLMRSMHVSPKNAFEAVFISGLIYDVMGSGAPERGTNIYTMKLDDNYLKSIRQSVLYKATGALYGVSGKKMLEVNMDQVYENMFKTSVPSKGEVATSQLEQHKNIDNFFRVTGVSVPFKTYKKFLK